MYTIYYGDGSFTEGIKTIKRARTIIGDFIKDDINNHPYLNLKKVKINNNHYETRAGSKNGINVYCSYVISEEK